MLTSDDEKNFFFQAHASLCLTSKQILSPFDTRFLSFVVKKLGSHAFISLFYTDTDKKDTFHLVIYFFFLSFLFHIYTTKVKRNTNYLNNNCLSFYRNQLWINIHKNLNVLEYLYRRLLLL